MKTTVRFFRHGGIYSSDVSFSFKPGPTLTAFRPGTTQAFRAHRKVLRPTHRRDEFRPVIPQRDARQQSPSPLHRHAHPKSVPGSGTMNLQRTVNSVLTACVSPGDNPSMGLSYLEIGRLQRAAGCQPRILSMYTRQGRIQVPSGEFPVMSEVLS